MGNGNSSTRIQVKNKDFTPRPRQSFADTRQGEAMFRRKVSKPTQDSSSEQRDACQAKDGTGVKDSDMVVQSLNDLRYV